MSLDRQRLFGFFLSFTNIITLIFWRVFDFDFGLLYRLQNPSGNSWAFMPTVYADFIQQNAEFFVSTFIVLSLLTPLPFLIKKIPQTFCTALLTLTFVFRLAIFFSSYDFMGNYHYMNHLVMGAYLLSGNLFFIQLMLVLFYFGAGLLKLNWEWISGSALLVETFISGPLLIAACIYVVVLELVLVWGVFSENKLIKNLTLLQLFIFHIFSWHIVGFYYPCIMLTMLTVFLLYEPDRQKFAALYKFKASPWIYAYVFVFLAAQLFPKILNKNEAVTAEGRLFSLNMLDARAECLASFQIQTEQGLLYLDQPLSYAIRVRCDPLVYFNYGKKLCAEMQEQKNPSVILNLNSKKSTDEHMLWAVRDQELCREDVTYSPWNNSWIFADKVDSTLAKNSQTSETGLRHWRENPARTGESQHSVSFQATPIHVNMSLQSGIHSAAKSSPVGDRQQWFVGADNGWLWSFTGLKKSWATYFPAPVFGFHGSAVTTSLGNLIIGSYDGLLHKINGKTGQRIWAKKLGSVVGSSPLIIGSQIFVSVESLPNQSFFYSLDLATGETRWKSMEVPGLAHASLAYDAETELLVGATNAGLLIALDKKTGETKWRQNVAGKIIATPVLGLKQVFSISTEGVLSAHETATGNPLWSVTLDSGSRASPSYLSAEDVLIVPLENGRIVGVQGSSGKNIWESMSPHLHVSSGVLTWTGKTAVYWDQCAEKTLCAINATNGTILKKFSVPENFSSTPAIFDGSLLLTLDSDGGLWALGISNAD